LFFARRSSLSATLFNPAQRKINKILLYFRLSAWYNKKRSVAALLLVAVWRGKFKLPGKK